MNEQLKGGEVMNDKLRPVEVYEYKWFGTEGPYTKVFAGKGIFHSWGVDFEETGAGVGNFSTAIVEMPDGTIVNVPAEHIVFTDPVPDCTNCKEKELCK